MKHTLAISLFLLLCGCSREPTREEAIARAYRELGITVTDFQLTDAQKLARSKLVQSAIDAIKDRSIENASAETYAPLLRLADAKIVRPGEVMYAFNDVHARVKPYGERELDFTLTLSADEQCIRSGYLSISLW